MRVQKWVCHGSEEKEVAQFLPSGGEPRLKVINQLGYGYEPVFLFTFCVLGSAPRGDPISSHAYPSVSPSPISGGCS